MDSNRNLMNCETIMREFVGVEIKIQRVVNAKYYMMFTNFFSTEQESRHQGGWQNPTKYAE